MDRRQKAVQITTKKRNHFFFSENNRHVDKQKNPKQ